MHHDTEEQAPSRASHLLEAAEERIREYHQQHRGHCRGFVASDFNQANAALEAVVAENLARGPMFCEWGSGFGVVTMLASMLGFEAYGIEAQEDLVLSAEELCYDFDCDAQFVRGSFVSPEDSDLTASAGNSWWHTGEPAAYGELDLDPHDFDFFYAYPWPGEEDVFDALFLRYASVGTLLMTYNDTSGLRLQRKVANDSVELIGYY